MEALVSAGSPMETDYTPDDSQIVLYQTMSAHLSEERSRSGSSKEVFRKQ